MDVNMKQFWQAVEEAERVTLSTSAENLVTTRTISPLAWEERVVFYTSGSSRKARQIGANPHVALSFGNYDVMGTAEILGGVEEPALLNIRQAYQKRYPGAFDPKDPTLAGDEVFIAVTVGELSQWIFEGAVPVGFAKSSFA